MGSFTPNLRTDRCAAWQVGPVQMDLVSVGIRPQRFREQEAEV